MDSCTTVTPPRLPREQWPSHPRWPAQVLLLGSHRNFRRISRFLVDEVKAGVGLVPLELLYDRWKRAMLSHEHYEEHKLFPYLARRYQASMARLSAGHDSLREADLRVRTAFETALNESDEVARGTLVAALEHHDAVLVEHLDEEEETVIPMLLELGAEEFADYYAHSIGHLLTRLDETGPEACPQCGSAC